MVYEPLRCIKKASLNTFACLRLGGSYCFSDVSLNDQCLLSFRLRTNKMAKLQLSRVIITRPRRITVVIGEKEVPSSLGDRLTLDFPRRSVYPAPAQVGDGQASSIMRVERKTPLNNPRGRRLETHAPTVTITALYPLLVSRGARSPLT